MIGNIRNVRRVMMEKNLTRLKWKYVSHINMYSKEIDSGKLNFTELVLVVGISGPTIQRKIRATKQKDSSSLITKIANWLDSLFSFIETRFPKIEGPSLFSM
jgi:hypothetical protein